MEHCTTLCKYTLLVARDAAPLQVVTGRPLQMGDIAIIDFKAMRADTNELITGSQQRGMRLDTELGDRALGLAGGCSRTLDCSGSRGWQFQGWQMLTRRDLIFPELWAGSLHWCKQDTLLLPASPWGLPGGA